MQRAGDEGRKGLGGLVGHSEDQINESINEMNGNCSF